MGLIDNMGDDRRLALSMFGLKILEISGLNPFPYFVSGTTNIVSNNLYFKLHLSIYTIKKKRLLAKQRQSQCRKSLKISTPPLP